MKRLVPFSRAISNFLWTAGFASGVGGGLAWQVAKRLIKLKGHGRSGFRDFFCCFCLVKCILRQDATRMQKQLVNVLARSNKGEAWRWQRMSKYFYPESVYGEQGDKPQMRWRRRITFTEVAASYDDVNEAKPQRNPNVLPNPRNRRVLSMDLMFQTNAPE